MVYFYATRWLKYIYDKNMKYKIQYEIQYGILVKIYMDIPIYLR